MATEGRYVVRALGPAVTIRSVIIESFQVAGRFTKSLKL